MDNTITNPAQDALMRVQQKLRANKNKQNTFGGYSYRNKEGILEAVKPLLAEAKAIITIEEDLLCVGTRYYVKAKAHFTVGSSTITAISFAREAENKKGMDEAQITGACSSYAGKYALCNLLAIDDSSVDPDANNDHGKRLPTLAELETIMHATNRGQLGALYKKYTKDGVASGYLTDICKERAAQFPADEA